MKEDESRITGIPIHQIWMTGESNVFLSFHVFYYTSFDRNGWLNICQRISPNNRIKRAILNKLPTNITFLFELVVGL